MNYLPVTFRDKKVCSLPVPSTRMGWALLIFVAVVLLYLPFLGDSLIRTADEGQRAVPPLEMLRSGDWVVPRLNAEVYLKKPPMVYWQVALFYKLFGVSEFVARISMVLCGALLCAVTYLWARGFCNNKTSVLAAVICAANAIVMFKSRECQIDIPLTLFIVLCLWAWMIALRRIAQGTKGWFGALLLGTVALAFSHLYKGPVGFVFGAVAWVGTVVCLRQWSLIKNARWWSCLLMVVLSVIPVFVWACLVIADLGWQQVMDIWLYEAELHLVKATPINSGPPWYYVERIIVCFIPWIVWAGALFMPAFWKYCKESDRHFEWAYLSGTVLFSLVFLSLNTSKETEYMLGLVAPFSILLALSSEWLCSVRGVVADERKAMTVYRRIGGSPLVLVFGVVAWIVSSWVIFPIVWHVDSKKLDPKTIATVVHDLRHNQNIPVAVHDLMGTRPYVYYYLNELYPYVNTIPEIQAWFREHPNGALLTKTDTWDYMTSAGELMPPVRRLFETSEKGNLVLVQPQ